METSRTRVGADGKKGEHMEGVQWGGSRERWESELSVQFCQESKVALKIKFVHKIEPCCVSHAVITEGVGCVAVYFCPVGGLSGPLTPPYQRACSSLHVQEDLVGHEAC